MQFSRNSPSIPDRLIWKRDDGGVVFICGAGVSMPCDGANLPDFCKLTKKVMKNLRVQKDSNAKVILRSYMQKGTNIPIPYDAIFTELEEEYSIPFVENAICESLLVTETVDRKYHDLIRELATSRDRDLRLITTNFDGLFSTGLEDHEYTYPNFPKNINSEGFFGLVNLHGKCNKCNDSDKRRLVFSLGSFGEAYVSSGEVTDFLKDVFSNYTVVFIGCAVDDPPIRYLLHAIANSDISKYDLYALQTRCHKGVENKWKNMKVKLINFDDYDCLWKTLELWRDRATKFDRWADSVIEVARQDPLTLEAWKISQVIHLVTHPNGAERISTHLNPIHENWLFLFDSKFHSVIWPRDTRKQIPQNFNNPFHIFFSENSIVNWNSVNVNNEVNGWDVFDVSPFDNHMNADRDTFGRINGLTSESPRNLLDRHRSLSHWIKKISAKPIVARWAIHQDGLHPTLRDSILKYLRLESGNVEKIMLQAWEDIFESWKAGNQRAGLELGQLQNVVKRHGWTQNRVKKYENLLRPRLKAAKLKREFEIDQEIGIPRRVEDVVTFSLEYTNIEIKFSNIDDLEVDLLKADRRNLDTAIKFEKKWGQYRHLFLPEILDTMNREIIGGADIYGITSLAFRYLKRFQRVLNLNMNAALDEYGTWPEDDINIYGHFRVWALRNSIVVPDKDIAREIAGLPPSLFWGYRYNLDLRYSIAHRWKRFSKRDISQVQEKIILGDPIDNSLTDSDGKKFKARKSLNMIQLLRDSGCIFESNIESKVEELKKDYSEWSRQEAIDFDRMLRLKGGFVTKNTDYSVLENVPKDKIVDIAEKDSGIDVLSQEERVPFLGLCSAKPEDAISALQLDASKGRYRRERWGDWFQMDWKNERYRRYLLVTTETLCSASNDQLAEMKDYVYYWFSKVSSLYTDDEQTNMRNALFETLLGALKSSPDIGSSVLQRQDQGHINWEAEAINAPAGQLARALLCFREFESLSKDSQLPPSWYKYASDLLLLDGDSKCFALIPFTQYLQKLHWYLLDWSRNNILRFLTSKDTNTIDAFWEGLSRCNISHMNLFLDIKDSLLDRVVSHTHMTRGVRERLLNWLLSGWLSKPDGERLVTNREYARVLVRGATNVRELTLTHLRSWKDLEENFTTSLHMQEVEEFIVSVWPLNQKFITEYSNIKLVELLILNPAIFPRISSRIIPNLKYFRSYSRSFNVPLDRVIGFAEEYPKELLDILFHTLPREIYIWPEYVPEMLETIQRVDNSLVDSDHFRFIQDRLDRHR